MYVLAYPWLLLLVLLPVLIRWLSPAYRDNKPALVVPWFNRMANFLNEKPEKGLNVNISGFIESLFIWLLWFLLVIAIARPQYLEPPLTRTLPTRDLMLLVDLSASMDAKDFINSKGENIERLTAVKEVLDEFLTRREGDRVGLIVFGNAAFVQVPFTQDLDVTRILLEETSVRMAGPKTAFGDAIGLAITLFEKSDVKERVIIALTDGNDTGSKVPPTEAAKIARDNDIKVFVVGVGDPETVGEEKLDEAALKNVASVTGGQYFFAADKDQLQKIYTELEKINTRKVEVATYRPTIDLFHWPLSAFLFLSFLYHLMLWLNRYKAIRKANYG
jgi:Ca-activated chloride channel family protein